MVLAFYYKLEKETKREVLTLKIIFLFVAVCTVMFAFEQYRVTLEMKSTVGSVIM